MDTRLDDHSSSHPPSSQSAALTLGGSVSVYEDDIEEILLTHEQIQTKVAEMGAKITRDYADRDLLLVGVLKGAFVLMADP